MKERGGEKRSKNDGFKSCDASYALGHDKSSPLKEVIDVLHPGRTNVSKVDAIIVEMVHKYGLKNNAGFGGQSIIERQVKKIAELRRLCAEGVNPWIEVDGGVTSKNAYKVSSTFCT